MGSNAIVIGVVGVVTALVSLLVGFLLGRKNVRSQIEDALEKEHVSLDAREFTIRQQLDEKIAEIAELRARNEELRRFQDPVERAKREQIKVAERVASQNQNLPGHASEVPHPVESADQTIQKLLKSLEDNLREPDVPLETQKPEPLHQPQSIQKPEPIKPQPIKPEPIKSGPIHEPQPIHMPQPISKQEPILKQEPVKKPDPINQQVIRKPEPIKSPAGEPGPVAQDEWQEFAASLEALTRRKI